MCDRWVLTSLILAVGALVVIGLSLQYAANVEHDILRTLPTSHVGRQLVVLLIGAIVCAIVAFTDYHRWVTSLFAPIQGAVLAALAAVFACAPMFGAWRWYSVGDWQFQPSELSKIGVILCLAAFNTSKAAICSTSFAGLRYQVCFIASNVILIALEPDFQTATVLTMTTWVLFVAKGVRMKRMLLVAAGAELLVLVATVLNPFSRARLLAWWDPATHPELAGCVTASREAFRLGGVFGTTLGPHFRWPHPLPSATKDFSFAFAGLEFGWIGVVGIALCFAVILACGLRIAHNTSDVTGRMLALGATAMICIQAFLNMATALTWLPGRPPPLPFVSAGGSGLLVALFEIGLLAAVAMQSQQCRRTGKHN